MDRNLSVKSLEDRSRKQFASWNGTSPCRGKLCMCQLSPCYSSVFVFLDVFELCRGGAPVTKIGRFSQLSRTRYTSS